MDIWSLQFLPKHTAAAAGKHRNLSHVEQEGLPPMPNDRGTEQGDVDGPLECSLASGMVAARTRRRDCVDDPSEEQRLQADHTTTVQESANFQLGGPGKLTGADHPQHTLQRNGGLADL